MIIFNLKTFNDQVMHKLIFYLYHLGDCKHYCYVNPACTIVTILPKIKDVFECRWTESRFFQTEITFYEKAITFINGIIYY